MGLAGLSLLLAATGMTSCKDQEDTSLSGNPGDSREVSFRVSGTRLAKATTTTTESLTNFTLTGLYVADDDDQQDDILMDAVVVTRNEQNSSTWDYFPKAVWPNRDRQVYFYAYSPANSVNVIAGFKGETTHTLTYKVPADLQKQEDFMVAVQETNADATNGMVSLNFKHALSRVLVNARAATSLGSSEVIVKSIKFMNLASEGTLILEKDNNADEMPETGWGHQFSIGWPTDTRNLAYVAYEEEEIEWENPLYLVYSEDNPHFWQVDRSKLEDYPVDIRENNGIRISNDGKTYTSLTGDLSGLMIMPQQTSWQNPWQGDPENEDEDFFLDIIYTVNGKEYHAKKRVYDYWNNRKDLENKGTFCFQPGIAYEFNIIVGTGGGDNPAGEVIVAVGEVNEFTTDPERPGVDVERSGWKVGDHFDNSGPDDAERIVLEVDDRGVEVIKVGYSIYQQYLDAQDRIGLLDWEDMPYNYDDLPSLQGHWNEWVSLVAAGNFYIKARDKFINTTGSWSPVSYKWDSRGYSGAMVELREPLDDLKYIFYGVVTYQDWNGNLKSGVLKQDDISGGSIDVCFMELLDQREWEQYETDIQDIYAAQQP